MWRWLLRWTAPLLILVFWTLPLLAQGDEGGSGESGNPTAALPTVVAILSTMLVLLIVCKPSRKS